MNTQQFAQLTPITPSIYQRCQRFARRVQSDRAEAVYQRAIAVWVVSRYLNRFGYGTNLEESSAWNPALQLLTDDADLEVFDEEISLGTVECIPLAADAESLEIPEQAAEGDRIAYIAVEINAEQTWGGILGFTPALEVEFPETSIDREDLLEVDKLLDLLDMAESLNDTHLFSDLENYWKKQNSSLFSEQRLSAIAQLERALLLESEESFQVEAAAQEIESLLTQLSETLRETDLVMSREEAKDENRQELRSILRGIFQKLRERLE